MFEAYSYPEYQPLLTVIQEQQLSTTDVYTLFLECLAVSNQVWKF